MAPVLYTPAAFIPHKRDQHIPAPLLETVFVLVRSTMPNRISLLNVVMFVLTSSLQSAPQVPLRTGLCCTVPLLLLTSYTTRRSTVKQAPRGSTRTR